MNNRNRLLIVSLISLLIIVLASACGTVSINLTLDANGGVFEGGSSTYVINTDGTSTVTIPTNPTKDGYDFGGWFWDKDIWAQPFTAGSLLDAPIQSDMKVYAKWLEIFTITFNSNGGSEVPAIIKGCTLEISAPTAPIKTGYEFAGWYNNIELTEDYTFSTMPEEDITLYAKWLEIFTITFNSNGGSEVPAIIKGCTLEISAPTAPIKTGYEFAGWYNDIELTEDYTFSTMPEEDITLYADWGTAGLIYTLINDNTEYSVAQGTATSLTEIIIPKRINGKLVTIVGDQAFLNCTNLTNISIPEGVTSIGYEAFALCTSLTSITIPCKTTAISAGTFYKCSSLVSITIPDSVTSIWEGAFASCSSLTEITIPSSVINISTFGSVFIGCTNLTNITVDTENTAYMSVEGVLFNKLGTTLMEYPIGNVRTNYTIPDGVTNIASFAFFKSNLLTIIIPEGVTSIGAEAFSNCPNLTSISIPESVEIIGSTAFVGCSNLETAYINRSSALSITIGGNSMFFACATTFSIYVPDSASESAYKTAEGWSDYADRIFAIED